MAISKPCPRCQAPMEIPQPPPEKFQCAKCGVVIKFAKAPAPAAAPTPAPVEAPKPAAAKSSPDFDFPAKAPDTAAKPRKDAPDDAPAKGVPKRGFGSALHARIPKPILFGFYGALGGLLGVMLLGELLWFALRPTPLVPVLLKLSLPPSDLTVYPGNDNRLPIQIQRQPGLEGPVRIEAAVPWDLTISPVTIPADADKVELVVTANDGADQGYHDVKLTATLEGHPQAKTTEPVRVIVDPTPPTLQVSVPQTVSVYAGGQNRFGFVLARRGFPGPVRLEVLDLPKGLSIPMVEIPEPKIKPKKKGKTVKSEKEESDEEVTTIAGQMTIVATKDALGENVDRDAKMVPYLLDLEVRALKRSKIDVPPIKIQINVEPPPGKLQLAVSPAVTVYPGSKNKFMVRISRQEFKAPVELKVTGQTRGVVFSPAIIEEGKSEAEVEVFAGNEVALGDFKDLRVTGKALVAEDIAASVPLELRITPPPPTVQMAVSPKVSAYPGGKGTFGVKIARHRFTGPVQISGTAGHVSVAPVVIPADKTDSEVEINVSPAALGVPLPHATKLMVVARSIDGKATSTEPTNVEILAPPSDLQLTVSPEVDIYQAGKSKFTVKIARSGFVGPVQLAFKNAPAGVNFVNPPIAANDVVVNASATIDVEPKKYEIDVVGTGPKAPDGKVPTITKKMTLNVKPFDPTIRPPLDIVFVLDVTTSMDEPIAGVKNGIGQFVKALKDRELDARIGLVAFRDITEDNAAHPLFEILKFNKKEMFTTDTKAFSTEVGKLKAVGGGDGPESSLDALEQASRYPFRPKALRILLLITDEEPQTKGNSVKMPAALKLLAEKKIDQIHLIVPSKFLKKYQPLHTVSKGGVFDFDVLAKKKKGSFAGLLPLLSREIVTTIGAPEPVALVPKQPDSAPPPTAPPGEKAPEPRAELNVTSPRPQAPPPPRVGEAPVLKTSDPQPPQAESITPPAVAKPAVSGALSTHAYAAEDRLQLLIAMALLTAAIATGIAFTLVAAQKRYLRSAWLSLGEMFKAIAGGLTAGLLAGALSQLFLQYTPGSAVWNNISTVIAWTLLGGLIGAGMGFFVPNLQWRRAAVGGCVGGVIGGAGFLLVSMYAGELLGRWLGAALLGFCIGVMVALAEVAFRRYWLEVAFGREVRTVTLGPATVALGGDAALVGVLVPNALPRALGYRVDRHRVICEDFATGKTFDAPPGDERTLEGAKIRVCSAASAQPIGVSLNLIVTRELALMEGMPLTAEDIPGLEAQAADGIVAVVNRRPNNPKIFVLRNRSKQAWTLTEADGSKRRIEPGLGVELSNRAEVDFGQVKAILDPNERLTK